MSYLDAFDLKAIRSARRIISHGITVEDIDKYLSKDRDSTSQLENALPERKAQFVKDMKKRGWELKKPCGGCKKKKLQAEKENK